MCESWKEYFSQFGPQDEDEVFTPTVQIDTELDFFTYLEVDCAYTLDYSPDTNIAMLRDGQNLERIVGVRIFNFSSIKKASEIS